MGGYTSPALIPGHPAYDPIFAERVARARKLRELEERLPSFLTQPGPEDERVRAEIAALEAAPPPRYEEPGGPPASMISGGTASVVRTPLPEERAPRLPAYAQPPEPPAVPPDAQAGLDAERNRIQFSFGNEPLQAYNPLDEPPGGQPDVGAPGHGSVSVLGSLDEYGRPSYNALGGEYVPRFPTMTQENQDALTRLGWESGSERSAEPGTSRIMFSGTGTQADLEARDALEQRMYRRALLPYAFAAERAGLESRAMDPYAEARIRYSDRSGVDRERAIGQRHAAERADFQAEFNQLSDDYRNILKAGASPEAARERRDFFLRVLLQKYGRHAEDVLGEMLGGMGAAPAR